MSFSTFAFFALFYFCMSFTIAKYSNFSPKYTEFTGQCPTFPDAQTTQKLAQGRWYIIRSGNQPEQAQNVRCEVWDVTVGHNGALHIYTSLYENNVAKTIDLIHFPKQRRNNYYTISQAGFEHLNMGLNLETLHYYQDKQVFIHGFLWCKEDGIYHRAITVGVRDMSFATTELDKINHYVNQFQQEGFESDNTEIIQTDCDYPVAK